MQSISSNKVILNTVKYNLHIDHLFDNIRLKIPSLF